MALLDDISKAVKKASGELKSNKDFDDASKKDLMSLLKKAEDNLSDLAPRREELEEMISGAKTLQQQVGDDNRRQDTLKDNGTGISKEVKTLMNKNKGAAGSLKTLEKIGNQISGLTQLKQ